MLYKNRAARTLIHIPYRLYREVIDMSSRTGDSIRTIIARGIMLGMLESMVRKNGGYLLVQSSENAEPRVIK